MCQTHICEEYVETHITAQHFRGVRVRFITISNTFFYVQTSWLYSLFFSGWTYQLDPELRVWHRSDESQGHPEC